MINLFTTYFKHKSLERTAEIQHALEQNVYNPSIDTVYLLSEADVPNFPHTHVRRIEKRPTFKDFFDWANSVTQPDDLNVFCNSDIFFDSIGLPRLQDWMCKADAIALTRWEITKEGYAKFNGDGCCQDTWAFCGTLKPIAADFPMGYRGCDNKLAYEIRQAGYTLLNPAYICKTYHYHLSEVRDWTWTNDKFVEGPYNCVEIDPRR